MKKLILLLTTVLFSLTGCGPTQEETRTYGEYQSNHLSSLNDFFTLNYDSYFIELYQVNCSHCEATKTTVFNYLDKQNEGSDKTPLFLFDLNSGNGSANRNRFKEKPSWYDGTNYDALVREMEENKPSTLNETYFIGTPTIYEIVDHKVSQVYIGSNEINGVLNSQ